MASDLASLDCTGQAELVRAGEVSPAELIEADGAATLLSIFSGALDSPGADSSPFLLLGAGMLEASVACDVSFDALGGGSTGTDYGDDPVLDALWDDCVAGSGSACDQLYFQSPLLSEYERFGATCGDRFELSEAPQFCEGSI